MLRIAKSAEILSQAACALFLRVVPQLETVDHVVVTIAVIPQPCLLAAEWACLPGFYVLFNGSSTVHIIYNSFDHQPLDENVRLNSGSNLLILFFFIGVRCLVDGCLEDLAHLQQLDHTRNDEGHEKELSLGVSLITLCAHLSALA